MEGRRGGKMRRREGRKGGIFSFSFSFSFFFLFHLRFQSDGKTKQWNEWSKRIIISFGFSDWLKATPVPRKGRPRLLRRWPECTNFAGEESEVRAYL